MRYEINRKATGPLYLTEKDIIKENSNCPDSEKSGTGPGSCGGSKEGTIETGPDGKKYTIPSNKDTGGTKEGKIAMPKKTGTLSQKAGSLLKSHFEEMAKNNGDPDTESGSELMDLLSGAGLNTNQLEQIGNKIEAADTPEKQKAVLEHITKTYSKRLGKQQAPARNVISSKTKNGDLEYSSDSKKGGQEKAIVKGNRVILVHNNNPFGVELGSAKEAQDFAKNFVGGSKSWNKIKTEPLPVSIIGKKIDETSKYAEENDAYWKSREHITKKYQ